MKNFQRARDKNCQIQKKVRLRLHSKLQMFPLLRNLREYYKEIIHILSVVTMTIC